MCVCVLITPLLWSSPDGLVPRLSLFRQGALQASWLHCAVSNMLQHPRGASILSNVFIDQVYSQPPPPQSDPNFQFLNPLDLISIYTNKIFRCFSFCFSAIFRACICYTYIHVRFTYTRAHDTLIHTNQLDVHAHTALSSHAPLHKHVRYRPTHTLAPPLYTYTYTYTYTRTHTHTHTHMIPGHTLHTLKALVHQNLMRECGDRCCGTGEVRITCGSSTPRCGPRALGSRPW